VDLRVDGALAAQDPFDRLKVASGVDRATVHWVAEEHSPAGGAVARAVPSRIVIDRVD
jgi:hypothetical protein